MERKSLVSRLGALVLVGALWFLPGRVDGVDFYNINVNTFRNSGNQIDHNNFYGAHDPSFSEGFDPGEHLADFSEDPGSYSKTAAYTQIGGNFLDWDFRPENSLTDYNLNVCFMSNYTNFGGRVDAVVDFKHPAGMVFIDPLMFYTAEAIAEAQFTTNGVRQVDKKAILANTNAQGQVIFNLYGLQASDQDDFAQFNIHREYNDLHLNSTSGANVSAFNPTNSAPITNGQVFAYSDMQDAEVFVNASVPGRHIEGMDIVRTDINTGDRLTNSVSFPKNMGSYVYNFSTNLCDLVGHNAITNIQTGIDQVQLIINTPRGNTSPNGIQMYNWGDNVSVSLNGSPETNGLERYVCEGWNLVGGQTGSGTNTTAEFNLTNNATLNFDNWKTQYMYSATAGENGIVSGVTNGWHDAGDIVQTHAEAKDYHHFKRWTGDVSSTHDTLEVVVNEPKSVNAEFEVNRTGAGVPETWYAENNIPIDDNGQSDNDAYSDSQEYWLDTCPTNGADYFYTATDKDTVILGSTSTKVNYGVDFRESLTSGDWESYTNGVIGSGGEIHIPSAGQGFYRGRGERVSE